MPSRAREDAHPNLSHGARRCTQAQRLLLRPPFSLAHQKVPPHSKPVGAASSVDIETAADARRNGVAGEATGEPAARHARVLARGARKLSALTSRHAAATHRIMVGGAPQVGLLLQA